MSKVFPLVIGPSEGTLMTIFGPVYVCIWRVNIIWNGKICIYHGIVIREYQLFREMNCNCLTHWGRVTHICVSKLTIIGSDNGLSPDRRQAIIWTNAGLLLIGPLGTNFSEILIKILTFSFKKILFESVACETVAILSQPQCVMSPTECHSGLNKWQGNYWVGVFLLKTVSWPVETTFFDYRKWCCSVMIILTDEYTLFTSMAPDFIQHHTTWSRPAISVELFK